MVSTASSICATWAPSRSPTCGWSEPPMPTDDQLIREVLARYVRHADERNASGWCALFAEDARFTPRSGTEYLGRPAIQAWFEELFKDGGPSETSLHLCGNQEIAVSGDTAEATSDVLVLHRDHDQPW